MPFHFNSTPLAPGSVIFPGNWGRIILRAGKAHHFYRRETILEDIRQAEFPDKPSRLAAAYFFDTEEMAKVYGMADQLRYIAGILYEVELLNPSAPQHRTDWNALPQSENPDADMARRYWQGYEYSLVVGAIERVEVLSQTPMKIVREIPY